jgi:bifunctional non-homologous end joining protein LigD
LIGEVAFRNWTPGNRLRHPSWRGLRNDRSPGSVQRTPEPIPVPPQGDVEGALETPDGQWGVEAIRRRKERFLRLIHGDNVVDGLAIATVEHLLGEAGVDMALRESQGAAGRLRGRRGRLIGFYAVSLSPALRSVPTRLADEYIW